MRIVLRSITFSNILCILDAIVVSGISSRYNEVPVRFQNELKPEAYFCACAYIMLVGVIKMVEHLKNTIRLSDMSNHKPGPLCFP